MTHDEMHDMGDHDAHHDNPDGHCDCSIANAQEMHSLVCALAEEMGVDLCDPHDMLEDDDPNIMDLRLVHDLAVAHGAHCDMDDEDDEPDDMDDEDGEPSDFEVHHFSADDDDDLEIIDLDLDDLEDDEYEPDVTLDDDAPDISDSDTVASFRKWTAEERDALPPEDFGDPSRKLFPIDDQDDLDSAKDLIGRAKNPDAVRSKIIAIAKRKGLAIPDAWKGN
jgi:hypothetical protein